MRGAKADDLSPDEISALIEQWHFEAFHGSCVARDTEVWNLVHHAKEELKQRLAHRLAAAGMNERD